MYQPKLTIWTFQSTQAVCLLRISKAPSQPEQYTAQQQRYNSSRRAQSCGLCESQGALLRVCAVLRRRSNHHHISTPKANTGYLVSNTREELHRGSSVIPYTYMYQVLGTACVRHFQCATTPGLQVNRIPNGNRVACTYLVANI